MRHFTGSSTCCKQSLKASTKDSGWWTSMPLWEIGPKLNNIWLSATNKKKMISESFREWLICTNRNVIWNNWTNSRKDWHLSKLVIIKIDIFYRKILFFFYLNNKFMHLNSNIIILMILKKHISLMNHNDLSISFSK